MTDQIRIGLVDDHQIVRTGLRQFLSEQEDFKIVGEASDGREAMALVRQTPMDVLLMDLVMPGRGGGDVMETLLAHFPDLAVLILSGYPEEHHALKVIRQGAKGYLNKNCTPHELAMAVRTAAAGKLYLSEAVGELLAGNLEKKLSKVPHETLTNRELQILVRAAKGHKPSSIADQLSLSVKTVSSYRTHMMQKMGLNSNSELTYYALKHGLID